MKKLNKCFVKRTGGSLLLGLLCQSLAWAGDSPAQPMMLAAAPMAKPDAATAPVSFAISAFDISGNEKLSSAQLQAVVAPFVGRDRHVDDLLAAKAALLKAYNDAGFSLVAVGLPKQIEKDGVVRLRVVEIKPAQVKVTGNQAYSTANIRAQLPALKDGELPDMAALDRQVQLANENPSRALRLEFQPGSSAGSADVDVQVTELDPLRLGLTLDNTGNSATGRTRLGLIVHHSNLWDKSHVAALSVVTSPEKPETVQQLGFSYQVPIPQWGDILLFTASHSSINNGLVANAFDVSGKGDALGLHYRRNLWRDGQSRHVLDVGLDQRQYKNVVDFFGFNLGVDVDERPISLAYVYGGQHASLEWGVGISHVRNLSGGGRNNDATYAASRAGAQADWKLWRYNADLKWHAPGDWLGLVSLSGQETDEPLISGEQWGLGGARSVRGYQEREVIGDTGQRLSLEVYSPRFAGTQRLLAFVDYGRMHRINAQVGEPVGKMLQGYGLGWRWGEGGKGLSLSLDLAMAGKDGVTTAKHHQSAQFSAVWWF